MSFILWPHEIYFVMDYYKVLGVRRDASEDEIKKAFRKHALQFHPDRHTQSPKFQQESASRRFREASEAYEVLSDTKKRAIYNREGRAGLQYERRHSSDARSRYGANSGGESCGANSRYDHHRRSNWSGNAGRVRWNIRVSSPSPMDIGFHALFAGNLLKI